MVVDDHPLSRKYLRTVLRQAGHAVLEARDGVHALQVAASAMPELVITDVRMPEMSGSEFARRLRADAALAHIPVVFCTATYRDTVATTEVLNDGASQLISKPASPDVILEVVSRILGPAQAESSAERRNAGSDALPGNRIGFRLATMLELGIDLLTQKRPEEVQQLFCKALLNIVPCEYAWVGALAEDGRTLVHCCAAGYTAGPGLQPGRLLPDNEAFRCLRSMGHMAPVRQAALAGELMGAQTLRGESASLLCLPLRKEGVLRAWIGLAQRVGQPEFDEEDEQIAVTLSTQAAVAYDNALLHEYVNRHAQVLEQEVRARTLIQNKLDFQVHHDTLTGLANPALLRDRLDQALAYAERYGESVALAYIDLDGFKSLNDTLGHAAGDEFLREFSSRLRACTRASDTVARKGGDEFVVVLTGLRSAAQVAVSVDHILATARAPVELAGQDCGVTASIGVAIFPDDGANAEALLSNADLAMYSAKQQGRNQIQFFHTGLAIQAAARNSQRALQHPCIAGNDLRLD